MIIVHGVGGSGGGGGGGNVTILAGDAVIGRVKITDGTDVADVLDLTNSNPVAVAIVDTNGDQISSFGGGTQYTEDAAAAANPVGTALNMVRADVLAGITTTDGDNVAARGTDKGELYVKHVDSIPVTQSGTWDEVGINDSGNSITVDNATISVVGSGTEATAQRVTIATDSTGVLSVDDNGGSLTVDGTVAVTNGALAVVGSGTEATALRVTVATDSTGVLSVDDNGGSLTVDGTVAVTGVATSANQSTQITAEQAIQTSVELIDDAIKADDAAFTPATTKVMMAGFEFDDSSPDSVDEGDAGAARMSARREVYIQIRDAAGNERGVNVNASNQMAIAGPVTVASGGIASGALASGSVASGAIASGAVASGAYASGAFASGAISDGANVTLGAKADAKSTATDTTAITVMSVLKQISASVQAPPSQAVTNTGTFLVQENGTQIVADDSAFTPGTTKVIMAGFEADESSTDSVDEGDGGAARMTLDRKQIVTIQPHTAGGLSVFNGTSSDGGTALTSTAQVISAAAGQVYGWYIYNPNPTAQFVQFYNTAQASVTVGTTNPLFMLTIPATSAANVNFVQGITFSNTGFSCSATSTAGGSGAPTTALDAVVFYK